MKRTTLISSAIFLSAGAVLAAPLLAFADGDKFVPLTQLPGLSTIAGSSLSLPSLINNLYRICIGLAAFFAVVQITWAGYLFMTSADSISANTKARGKIFNAVIGLVLVLAPFVVFSIINPAILNISLNFSSLQSGQGSTGVTAGSGTTQSGTGSAAVTPQSCTATGFTGIKAVASSAGCSSLGSAYTSVADGCCAGMASGNVCCGNPSGL